ncbi:hypothetical protein [Paraburkholderia sp.]
MASLRWRHLAYKYGQYVKGHIHTRDWNTSARCPQISDYRYDL